MIYAPINPMDLLAVQGLFPVPRTEGKARVGHEGVGEIVAIGNNLKSDRKIGEKVHVIGNGTWAEFMVTNSENATPVQPGLSLEAAACHMVNPGTVVYMSILAKGNCAIHTTGASALGRMMIKYFKQVGIKLINIVRKEKYVSELKAEGADWVLNSEDKNFEAELSKLIKENNVTTCFNAIGGDTTAKILKLMPECSTIYVYGAMGDSNVSYIPIEELLFGGKVVTGFSLTRYFEGLSESDQKKFVDEVHNNLNGSLSSNIQKVFGLDQLEDAVKLAEEKGAEGKVLLKCGKE